MRRTEFVLIADALKEAKPAMSSISSFQQWKRDCIHLASALKRNNPAFDVQLFLKNCTAG